ncbi:MAG: Dabb family protein [Candidatus Cyclobacteriaceae bacterium M3_2C_046]
MLRRSFFGKFKILLGLPFLGLQTQCSTRNLEQNVFIHHVYFWLKKDLTSQQIEKFEQEGLKSLTTIETVKMSHIGVPASTNRSVIDTSYSYSLMLIFDSLADQEVYQKHPTHLKFVENFEDYWNRVVVYDSIDA